MIFFGSILALSARGAGRFPPYTLTRGVRKFTSFPYNARGWVSNPCAWAMLESRPADSSTAETNKSSLLGFSHAKKTWIGMGVLPNWRAAGSGKADGEFAWER